MKLSGILLFFFVFSSTGRCANQLFNISEDIESLSSQKIVGLSQDYDGFLWVATQKNVFRFDGSQFKNLNEIITIPNSLWREVLGIEIDPSNRIWILTLHNGLYIYDKKTLSRPVWHNKLTDTAQIPTRKLIFSGNIIWLINQYSISQVSKNNEIKTTVNDDVKSDVFKNAILDKDNNILIATKKQLNLFNTNNHTYRNIKFTDQPMPPYIWDIHVDASNNLWLATDIGIYRQLNQAKKWQPFQAKRMNTPIKSIASDSKNIWFATAINGLFQYDSALKKLYSHQHNNNPKSLPTNELTISYTDNSQNLWLASFDNKLINTTQNLTDKKLNIDCANSDSYYAFTEFHDKFILVAQDGIVIQSKDHTNCQFIQTDDYSNYDSITLSPQAIAVDSNEQVWIGGRLGLVQLETQNEQFSLKDTPIDNSPKGIHFVALLKSNMLLLGTASDLVLFDINSRGFRSIDNNISSSSPQYTGYTRLDSIVYLATSRGVLLFDLDSNEFIFNSKLSLQTYDEHISAITHDQHTIYFSIKNKGLFSYNLESNEVETLKLPDSLSLVYSLKTDKHQNLWLTTNLGIIKYDLAKHNFFILDKNHGIFDYSYILNSFYEASNSQMYFGSKNGLIRLDPDNIYYEQSFPPLAITQLTRFNEAIKLGQQYDEFGLSSNINDLKQLEISHRERVIGFQFSVLDLIDASQYSYAYRLQGFDPNWNYTSSKNHNITYTNLPSGQYTLEIKAKNSNNLWFPEIKSLKIKVQPAPWLSWWAFVLYLLALLTGVILFIHLRVKASRNLAQQLALDVAKKTKTLNKQKRTIEQLLDKKNELFSQVSHEFRTPLTLILGPIKDILQSDSYHKNKNELTVIARNANRLLSLVEQLLSLAKASNFNGPNLIQQNTQQQVSSVVGSFQFMAKKNNLNLILNINQDANINATDQCIHGILGNLVSNAIKYSKPNSDVVVNSYIDDEYLNLTIKDSGPGLTDQNMKEIFQHFNRMPQHQNIEGLGIGLSVVDELVRANKGILTIHSELGVGSEFCIQIPISHNSYVDVNNPVTPSSLINQISLHAEWIQESKELIYDKTFDESDRYTLLIIEDNHDMRQHIQQILTQRYDCYLAANGLEGIKLAIEHIPDMIICDVMMPVMDGFKVSRIIRSDDRTSHIPLMLLTALNDPKNRIKGWREQVDSYMTKPFDRDELLIRIENILSIRDILKKRIGHRLVHSNLSHTELPKVDRQFIEKLNSIYAEHYKNPLLSKTKIAHLMAVSERQLQRKLKALIDQNPMDMLREFRLKKSCDLLKDGYQVGIVSDECGFNSPSYFSQCFKAQYGTSPKQYQQTINDLNAQ